ncbi:MAG: hypothetical protein HY814_12250, partial [Candidatus Riflebacteria bacterium]|nr:hypothetical protein [Candidatus Riflebacteria bacterium]
MNGLILRFYGSEAPELAFPRKERPLSQLPFDDATIARTLEHMVKVRSAVLSEFKPEFESPGSEPVLTTILNHKGFRWLTEALSDSVLGLLAKGQAPEALALTAKIMEMSRLLGRGVREQETANGVLNKAVEIKVLYRLDTMVAAALQRHLVPPSHLKPLAALYLDQVRREPGLDGVANAVLELLLAQRAQLEKPVRLHGQPVIRQPLDPGALDGEPARVEVHCGYQVHWLVRGELRDLERQDLELEAAGLPVVHQIRRAELAVQFVEVDLQLFLLRIEQDVRALGPDVPVHPALVVHESEVAV